MGVHLFELLGVVAPMFLGFNSGERFTVDLARGRSRISLVNRS